MGRGGQLGGVVVRAQRQTRGANYGDNTAPRETQNGPLVFLSEMKANGQWTSFLLEVVLWTRLVISRKKMQRLFFIFDSKKKVEVNVQMEKWRKLNHAKRKLQN